MMREKESGRRKRTERAKKWREWALIMRFDSDKTPQKVRECEYGRTAAMDDDHDESRVAQEDYRV